MRYEVDGSYKIEEWFKMDIEADDVDQAEDIAREQAFEMYPDVTDITVDMVREIK